ncbi:hypothetical protein HPP92_019090 [Vanilla planifolia]|uniref:Uncharacterized protein n=1 Tax=Vanilla planifolia TaxID=51239 RepID=A0A835Q6Y4_VANPL|nr:hypothetical protein HPP92_019090 [Vanilla planifolia]
MREKLGLPCGRRREREREAHGGKLLLSNHQGSSNGLYNPDDKNHNELKHYQLMKPKKCYKNVEGNEEAPAKVKRRKLLRPKFDGEEA